MTAIHAAYPFAKLKQGASFNSPNSRVLTSVQRASKVALKSQNHKRDTCEEILPGFDSTARIACLSGKVLRSCWKPRCDKAFLELQQRGQSDEKVHIPTDLRAITAVKYANSCETRGTTRHLTGLHV